MVYLFIYNDAVGNREYVKSIIESISEINAWRYDMPNCFYLSSDYSAQELTDTILGRIGKSPNRRLLILEITENRQGYLPKATWQFLRDNK